MRVMDVTGLRRTDRWVGALLCALLSVRWKQSQDRPGAGESAPPRSILLVKLAEQGSTVLAWPAIARAAALVGRERVFFLVFEENRFILDLLGAIPPENVVTVETGSLPRALLSSLRAVLRLRRLGIDAAVDLENFARASAVFAFLSGARRRVGCHSFAGEGPWRGDLMTHRLVYNPHLHAGAFFLAMVEALGFPAGDFPAFPLTPAPAPAAPPRLTPAPREIDEIRTLLRDAGVPGAAPLLLLNANCSDLLPLRRWPGERYAELARRLADRHPEAWIVFTGGPGEEAAVERLVRAAAAPRCVSLAGKTTLRQLLALYHLAEVLVSNDSGPAQFAALTSVDAVVLFGPETPALYAPRSPRTRVLWAGLACSPCVSAYNNRVSRCRENRCLQAISVEQVLAAVDDISARRLREAGRGT